MNVLHLTASRFFGGPERQMLALAGSLPPPVRSAFASFSEGGLCRAFLDEVRRCGQTGLELRYDTPRLFAALREIVRLLRKQRIDVLCCHGYKANLLGLLAARWVRTPVISVSRGWTGETLRVRLYEILDRRVLRQMDCVVAVSHGQAKKVLRSGVQPSKMNVIHNAVHPRTADDVQSEYADRLRGLFHEPPRLIVGAAGRLSPEKGFDVLIDAAATVSRVHPQAAFVLFGDGALRESLQAKIHAGGLDEKFILAGFHADYHSYLPHVDLLVLPSYTEGLPNVVLEAFAAGVPVVATAVGGTPEVVEDGRCGYLVPPGDAAELAGRIADVLSDDDTRRAMGAQGRERVAKHFSYTAQAESYQRLFRCLAPPRTANDNAATATSGFRRKAKRANFRRRANSPQDGPVRVCFMIDNLDFGGTETQLLTLIRRLDRSKVEPYLCLLDGQTEQSRALLPKDCRTLRLGVKSLCHPSTLRRAWQFVRFLRRERIDVLQVHFSDSTHFGVPLARLARVPYVIRTRRNLGYRQSATERRLGRLLGPMIDATIANCGACRQAVIEQERARPESVVVLENGVDLGSFTAIDPRKADANLRRATVGMVANLRPIKAPEVFIHAAKLLEADHPNVDFRIAGTGNEKGAMQVIEANGMTDRFTLAGRVDDVASFLAGLDVAVLTSRSEGLSNSVIEYMAAGLPVVATAVGGNVELIEDGVSGLLVPPDDPQAVADAVDCLLRDPPLAVRMAAAARARVVEQNSLQAMVLRHETFYANLVEDGKRSRPTELAC